MPTVSVLLGAGASVDADIPSSVHLTDAVIARVDNREQQRILEFVRHTLAASLAEDADDGWGRGELVVAVDVERLFAAVELLIDRENQPWSPFVAGWHPGLERLGPPPESDFHLRTGLERAIGGLLNAGGERRLAEAILKAARPRLTGVSELLSATRRSMLGSLFEILAINDPVRVRYLEPLVKLAEAQGALTIATLNYDRAIENVAEVNGVSCDTGIETWLSAGSLTWSEPGIRLLKLHGSIDWVADDHWESGTLPMQQIHKVVDPAEKRRYEAPAVIFGEAGKLRAEGPYLELLLAWATHLNSTDRLLICGYSFRDPHVNEIIARWFNDAPERRIVLLDVNDLLSHQRRETFGWYLSLANKDRMGREATPKRVEQVVRTAAEGLAEAIELASASDSVSGGGE